MKVGDTVNIMKTPNGYWKGKITLISTEYNENIEYLKPIATVNGIHNEHAVVIEDHLSFKDGEYWEWKV